MKRKEAIQIIYEQMLRYMPEEASEGVAEKILDRLEEAGVLPPEVDISKKCSDPALVFGPHYFDEYVPQGIILGWEDE